MKLTLTEKDFAKNNMSTNILDYLTEKQKQLYLNNRESLNFRQQMIVGQIKPIGGEAIEGISIEMSW